MKERLFIKLIKHYLYLWLLLLISVLFTVLASFDVFQKLDYRMYDILLGTKKQTQTQKEKIVFVDVDDGSINELGQWPWTRDILGDALIRMRELGAKKAVFDIEYLSASQLGVNPKAVDRVAEAFTQGSTNITSTITELTDAFASGQVSKDEVSELSNELLIDYIDPELQNLYSGVMNNMFRDNDEYFARAVQFFGDTWLTIGTKDLGIPVSDEDIDYLHKRFMLKNVIDEDQLFLRENTNSAKINNEIRGLSPAIHNIINHANGAGFTNVIVDSDGTRRRIEVLANFEGDYVPQLVISPLLDELKPSSVERKGNKVILHDVILTGTQEKKTITIPLDNKGRMLINWLPVGFEDTFVHNPVRDLLSLDSIENNIIYNLSYFTDELTVRDSEGFDLPYLFASRNLLAEHKQLEIMKQNLLERCKGFDEDGIAIDGGLNESDYKNYFNARQIFFDDVKAFIDGEYFVTLVERLNELNEETSEETQEIINVAQSVFDAITQDYKTYTENFITLTTAYQNAFCIVGNTSTGSTDLGTTPFRRNYPNVGTHANVLNTILNEDFITPVSWIWGITFVFVFMFIVILLTHRLTSGKQTLIGLIYVVIPILSIILLMKFKGLYIPLMIPMLTVVTVYIAEVIYHFIASVKDKNFLKRAFSTYLSKDVVNVIVKDPSKLTLGGQDKHITALFSDVKSFSSFSELVSPTKLVEVLNVYLGQLSDAIMDAGGTIDKYIGDEIVSFFGAPLDFDDHAFRACEAGIRMKQLEAIYNKEHFTSGDIPRALESRIGINTGNMVVGNMGTNLKMNYTIMGNDVNLASRLEGVNKMYHSWILTSEQTWKEADSGEHKGELFSRKFDRVRVVGIDKPVQLYNILGFTKEISQEQKESVNIFHEGLDKYLNRDFVNAGKLFVESNKCYPIDDSPLVFAARCKDYIEKGLPPGWDGIINMTQK